MSRKKRYVTLEWPPNSLIEIDFATVVFRSEATDGEVRITAAVDEETERRVTRVDWVTETQEQGLWKTWCAQVLEDISSPSSYSHFYVGSMFGDTYLRVAQSYTSSPDSPFSLMSPRLYPITFS